MVQLPEDWLDWAVVSLGAAVPPGVPPVWALAEPAPTVRVVAHASPAIARIVRLLVNLPLSLLSGLADGLALKVRATQHNGCDSPQQLGPPISDPRPLAEIQRIARGTLATAAVGFTDY